MGIMARRRGKKKKERMGREGGKGNMGLPERTLTNFQQRKQECIMKGEQGQLQPANDARLQFHTSTGFSRKVRSSHLGSPNSRKGDVRNEALRPNSPLGGAFRKHSSCYGGEEKVFTVAFSVVKYSTTSFFTAFYGTSTTYCRANLR